MKLATSTSGSNLVELLLVGLVIAALAVLAVTLTARAFAITADLVDAVDSRVELINSL